MNRTEFTAARNLYRDMGCQAYKFMLPDQVTAIHKLACQRPDELDTRQDNALWLATVDGVHAPEALRRDYKRRGMMR